MPPKWKELADRLAEDIRSGTYGPGDKLPSQRELTRDGDFSDQVVKDAMKWLGDRGLVEGRRGAGYFVLPEPPADWMQRLAAVEEAQRLQAEEIADLKRRLDGP